MTKINKSPSFSPQYALFWIKEENTPIRNLNDFHPKKVYQRNTFCAF